MRSRRPTAVAALPPPPPPIAHSAAQPAAHSSIRRQVARGHAIDTLLARLAAEAATRRPLLAGLCVPAAGGSGLDWAAVPAVLHPSFGTDSAREQRKRWQLESLYAVTQLAVRRLAKESTASVASCRLRIVDFGSGTGNSALA